MRIKDKSSDEAKKTDTAKNKKTETSSEKLKENALNSNGPEEKMENDSLSDDEIQDIIRPELFTFNIPAILEILFGLFLFFIAIIWILVGLELYNLNSSDNSAFNYLFGGIGFIVFMCISFFVAYGLIMKKKYAPIIGAGKGIFFIIFFLNGVFYFRRLANEARAEKITVLTDIDRHMIHEANMYINMILLLFVLILTLSMIYILYKDSFFEQFTKGKEVT